METFSLFSSIFFFFYTMAIMFCSQNLVFVVHITGVGSKEIILSTQPDFLFFGCTALVQ